MAFNILVVDDSGVVRKAFLKSLSMSGIAVNKVFEAGNGQIALEILAKEWVDVVFLDINMPVMNGREFIKIVRANNDFKDLPVVIVSTEGSREARDEFEKAQVAAYLRKPVTPEILVSTIKDVLGDATNAQ